MDEDAERNDLLQVLKEKCLAAIGIVEDDDISKLVAEGYITTAALAVATEEDLVDVLPGRRALVRLLLKAFVQPAGKAPLNKSKSSLEASEALRQVLGEKYPDSGVEDDDFIKLVAAGFSTAAALAAATMERLDAALPKRRGVVRLLLKAFVQPAEESPAKKSKSLPGASEIKDRSEAWIRHMLPPQRPELPQNNASLENSLFLEQHLKLPVSKQFYMNVAGRMPELAANFLIEADGSVLPCSVTTFLMRQPGKIATKIQTTILISGCLILFFDLFKVYVPDFELTLSFNSTEKARTSFSEATVSGARPDTIAIASGCTFLVGEDNVDNLSAAEGDLCSKMKPLNPMFYGELQFILGYIAAGTKFQWMYIGKNGPRELYRVGRPLDLLNLHDRCLFLLSVGYASKLLMKMNDSVPVVPGRRPMFSKDESPDGKRMIHFYPNKVAKHIRDFPTYCAGQGTDITVIKRAYDAARACMFLPQAVSGPTETAHGSYRVEFGPVGYECTLKSEEECRWMAQRVCVALCTLHSEGLVHRDIRLLNIVRLSYKDFMLIDLESVADFPFILFDGFRPFSGWCPEMYEGNQYTPFSDMYSIGKLLDASLPGARTARAANFVRMLIDKQLSSSQALQHPWLSELMVQVYPNSSLIL